MKSLGHLFTAIHSITFRFSMTFGIGIELYLFTDACYCRSTLRSKGTQNYYLPWNEQGHSKEGKVLNLKRTFVFQRIIFKRLQFVVKFDFCTKKKKKQKKQSKQ